jgi:hypothetical protein
MIKRSATVKMMTIRRRVFRVPASAWRARCRLCGRDVDLLTRTQAASLLEADEAALNRLIEDDRVHVTRTVNGNLLICKDSLFLE